MTYPSPWEWEEKKKKKKEKLRYFPYWMIRTTNKKHLNPTATAEKAENKVF